MPAKLGPTDSISIERPATPTPAKREKVRLIAKPPISPLNHTAPDGAPQDMTATFGIASFGSTARLSEALPSSVGRAAQFRRTFRFRRLRFRFGFHRLDPGALNLRGLDARGHFYRAGALRRMQRTRMRHHARHQHLRRALVVEIAIGEAHARDRAAE